MTDVVAALDIDEWPAPQRERGLVAAQLAAQLYQGFTRDQGTPYIEHPVAVATLLRDEIEVAEAELLILALLHDALEVRPGQLQHIQDELGLTTANCLAAMTPDHRLQQRHRHADDHHAWHQKTERLPNRLLTIRLADRCHNLRDLTRSPNANRRNRFLAELDTFYLPLARRRAANDSAIRRAHLILSTERAHWETA